ncbi:MAG: hypothetical protein ABI200_00450, partial [Gaiellales bacterium]
HPLHEGAFGEFISVLRQLVARAQKAGVLRGDVCVEDITTLQCTISRTSTMPFSAIAPEGWRRSCSVFLDGLRPDGQTTVLAPEMPTYEEVFAEIGCRHEA